MLLFLTATCKGEFPQLCLFSSLMLGSAPEFSRCPTIAWLYFPEEIRKKIISGNTNFLKTRMHSSRMRTARLRIVPGGRCCPRGGGGYCDLVAGGREVLWPGPGGGGGEVLSRDLWCCTPHLPPPPPNTPDPPPSPLNRMSEPRLWKHNLRSLRYADGNKASPRTRFPLLAVYFTKQRSEIFFGKIWLISWYFSKLATVAYFWLLNEVGNVLRNPVY